MTFAIFLPFSRGTAFLSQTIATKHFKTSGTKPYYPVHYDDYYYYAPTGGKGRKGNKGGVKGGFKGGFKGGNKGGIKGGGYDDY